MNKKILDTAIVIPAYNEDTVIGNTIKDALTFFNTVVIVNDNSSDKTAEEAINTGAIVLSHTIGLGQGGGIQTGIEYALEDPGITYFATMDADGQHRAKDIINMRKQLIKNNDDIVIGSRFIDGGTANGISPFKKIFLKVAVIFSNITSGTKFTDTHNGIRIFNRHVAETINIEESGYQHASEILEKIVKHGYKCSECPVEIRYTKYSVSKGQSWLNAVNIGADVIGRKIIRK